MKKKFFDFDKKAYLIFISLFLLLTPLVIADSPFRQFSGDNGYTIAVPIRDTIKSNWDYEINVHVFNESDGKPIISNIGCYIHVYNESGKHQIEMFDDTISHNFDYSFFISAKNFSSPGLYTIMVQCNSSALGGFSEYGLEVTPSGHEYPKTITFYVLILFISLFFIVLGFSIKDGYMAILGSFGLVFMGLYILINGIAGIKDPNYSWPIGIIILGVAAYISINSARELIE